MLHTHGNSCIHSRLHPTSIEGRDGSNYLACLYSQSRNKCLAAHSRTVLQGQWNRFTSDDHAEQCGSMRLGADSRAPQKSNIRSRKREVKVGCVMGCAGRGVECDVKLGCIIDPACRVVARLLGWSARVFFPSTAF